MSVNFYTFLFAGFFVLHHGIDTLLSVLQDRHLKKRKDKVPAHLEGKVDIETIRKAVRYNREKLRFGMVNRFVDMVPLWILLFWGFAWLQDQLATTGLGPLVAGLAFIGVLSAAGGVWSLPGELYFHFVIEERYGFNKQTLPGFFKDKLKELAVGLLLGGGLLLLVLFIMESFAYWWLLAFGVVALFQLVMMWVYPLFIMPLFNKFEPVEGELADAVAALAKGVGFPLKGVFQMDGSRRSAHSNAFFIGMKGSRRIVLYDTLIEKLTTPPLVAVLAHELGHFKLGHVQRRLWMALFLGAGVFALLGWIAGQDAFYAGLGFRAGSAAALVAFSLLFGELAFPFGFLSRVMSRRDEYAADRFAVNAVGGGGDLKEALVALTRQNLSSPGSHKWYRTWYNSHPSLRERLRAIDKASASSDSSVKQ